ncbi:MAG: hypothetical protein IKP40_08895 [Clostridia bacterium]|nr:hypothetical protein [Clostridia bacterium]
MKDKQSIINALIFGFGDALALAGFCGTIAAACHFTWLGMICAVCAFGGGLTMILIGGDMEEGR